MKSIVITGASTGSRTTYLSLTKHPLLHIPGRKPTGVQKLKPANGVTALPLRFLELVEVR